MPNTPKASPEAPASREEWVSVAAAAARLGLSAKTVRKRIAANELPARRVAQKRGGVAFLVSLETEVFPSEVEAERKRSGSEKTPSHVQVAPEVETEPEAKWNRSGSEMEVQLRADLERERENAAFLRGLIEQLQRDGAETRQHLKRALDLAPKQLTAGGHLEQLGTDSSAINERGGPQNSETSSNSQKATNGAKSGLNRAETPVSYGSIADELERMLNK